MPKHLYIETVGCQMNVLDSEMVVADLKKRGAVLVWEDGQVDAPALARLRSDYPGLEVKEPLVLPRQTFVARGRVHPVRVHIAIVPPRP